MSLKVTVMLKPKLQSKPIDTGSFSDKYRLKIHQNWEASLSNGFFPRVTTTFNVRFAPKNITLLLNMSLSLKKYAHSMSYRGVNYFGRVWINWKLWVEVLLRVKGMLTFPASNGACHLPSPFMGQQLALKSRPPFIFSDVHLQLLS